MNVIVFINEKRTEDGDCSHREIELDPHDKSVEEVSRRTKG